MPKSMPFEAIDPGMGNRFLVAVRDGESWLPEWLMIAVAEERLILMMRSAKTELPPEDRVGDAETLAYLMTVSLRLSMPGHFKRIYAHLTGRVMKSWGRETEVPEELRHDELTPFEAQQLQELKAEMCRIRGEIRHPLIKAVRRTAKQGQR
jgi:hypothetical protein